MTLTAARLATLATGRGGLPTPDEWPLVAVAVVLIILLGWRASRALGLTRVEAALLSGGAPALVLVDAPLGQIAPGMALAANATGCLLPIALGAKVLWERRAPALEALLLLGVGVLAAFVFSRVEPGHGVMLQYRAPAILIGCVAGALLRDRPRDAGAVAFAAGAFGVLLGADAMRLGELASTGGAGRVILGGAGMLDGILLVAILSAAVAVVAGTLLKAVAAPKRATPVA